VRSYLQNRFTHVFVDEFQDTDPLQAEVLLLVACGDPCETDWKAAAPAPGKLFVVGDPKQSIYKFRRADVGLYQEVSLALAERGVGFVHLTRSFRSVRPIQECVNAAFAPEMTGDPAAGQAMYAPLEEHAQSIGGQPSVIALPAPKPYGSRNVAKANINSCLPEAIVAFTEWLLNESGWKVRDPEESHQLVDVTARHVAILFRRFTNFGQDLTRDYTRGLEARGIPHLLVGSKSFHRREEVESLRAALAAIEWPDDELSVFATLKGPLFAISDESLLRFHLEHGRLHPFRRFGEEVRSDFRDLAEALGILAELHRDRNRRPFVETVNRLLEVARAHAGFAMRPGGQQVLANVYRVCDLARGFEVEGGISFRGFVEELEAQAERAESAEAPVLEEGAEGVRLITVHSAKGLEFPVVILADMTANLAAWEPERYVDAQRGLCAMRLLRCAPVELAEHEAEEKAREESEGVRVAYVAATRARDLLVVPAVGDQECDGWVRPLNKAIYPPRMSFRNAGRAAGCPSFGQATVLERPPEYMTGNEISVKPGAHTPRGGSHEVVWWDPSKLTLGVAADFGLRQEEILAEAPNDSLARFRAWETARQLSGERGSRPALMPFTATEAGQPPDDFSCDVALAFTDRATARPSGRRFGTLVHSVLSEADLKAERAPVARIASLHGSIIGASPAEIAAATDAVLATLAHPLIDRARSAMKVRREAPVTLRMGERLMEGIIDLAFEDESGWTIVDFKTDADLPSAQEGYRAQLAWYALALERSTGKPARAVLLGV
jgi:ATP-dependent exoDNAse (exonuclease V) beta subunit